MSTETREAILYGQMQKDLRWELMSPNVSGAMAYKELCVAAKGEEQTVRAEETATISETVHWFQPQQASESQDRSCLIPQQA